MYIYICRRNDDEEENDQTIFIHVYTRPCESGERAIGTCNRNKNSVREHSTQHAGHTLQRPITNIGEREKDRRNKMRMRVYVYRDKKTDRKIDRRQAKKKKNRQR